MVYTKRGNKMANGTNQNIFGKFFSDWKRDEIKIDYILSGMVFLMFLFVVVYFFL